MRTAATAGDRLASRVAELHPWDSPEVSASPLEWCLDSYAEWLERTTAEQGWARIRLRYVPVPRPVAAHRRNLR
ncbi:divalent cation tolerance protein CutA [Nocardia sp. NPDC049707]|uniref:divalent cation tolerance protein CutA n=1 Tax=Nocardia sp. NPDC049707 TaxID=3154735 RepID=UPI00342366E7